MRKKKVSIPIFDVNFVMWHGNNPTDIVRVDTREKVFDSFEHDRDGYGCTTWNKGKDGQLYVHVFIHSEIPDYKVNNTITHECEHAKDYILEVLGVEKIDTEINAMLIDYLFKILSAFVYNKKAPKIKSVWKKQQA